MNSIIIRILMVIIFISILSSKLTAETVYKPEVLFTIPWGENPGELSLFWQTHDPEGYLPLPAPSPFAISETGGYVVHDCRADDTRRLSKFTIDGVFVAQIDDVHASGLRVPHELYISDAGLVLLQTNENLYLLDQNLSLISEKVLPGGSSSFFPADNGGFWGIYGVYDAFSPPIEIYLFCYNPDGTTTDPVLLYEGYKTDYVDGSQEFSYVTPQGIVLGRLTDQYGYSYSIDRESLYNEPGCIMTLSRISPLEEIVYTHELPPITEWWHTDFMVSHSGNYFTQHGTPSGTVITKYSLNHDPICALIIVTRMPYVGSLPAAITFDASGSYDPDGDELNYHWDFNNDGIFDGVGDEYTGDPWNPTHEFNQYGIHDVMLKVTDNYGGECIAVVQVTILEMN